MKTTALLPFFFFFLLAAFTTRGEDVLDTEGYPLDKESEYSILPSESHDGKNIVIKPVDKNRTVCGLFLSVTSATEQLAVKISTESLAISTHSPVNFSFVEAVSSECAKSTQTQWVIGYGLPPPPYVMIGDPRETDHLIFNGSFFIDLAPGSNASNHTYILSFCDELESCALVGVQTGGRMVLLTEEQESLALRIQFKYVTPSPPPPPPTPVPPPAAIRKLVMDF